MRRLFTTALVLLLALPAAAAETQLVLYHQGRLLDAGDQPVTTSVDLTVRLYKSATGGASDLVWEETYTVTPTEGDYGIALGDTQNGTKKALTDADVAGDRWLAVSIAGSELSPRLKLGIAPHAALADEATNADQLGGVDASAYLLKADESTDALTLAGHPASDFLGATAQATDSAMLGGKTPDEFLGATDVAVDSAKLGGKTADQYALKTDLSTDALTLGGHPSTDFLGATAQATDAAKLGGKAADQYALKSDLSTDAATLGGHPASDFLGATAQATDAAKLGGHAPSEFVLAADNHPVMGPERLAFNFEEAATTNVVQDSSGAANDGTLSAGGLARVTSGHNNSGAVQFLGGGGLLTVPDAASLDLTTNVTLEAWVMVTSYPATGKQGIILAKDGQYGLQVNPSGSLQAYFATSVAGSKSWTGATAPLPLGTTASPQWTYVAATYDGNTVNLYVNGVLASMTNADNGPLKVPASPAALTIGGLTTDAATSFSGIIDEVRVSSIAKTFRSPPPYIKLGMGANQSVGANIIVAFNRVEYARGLTSWSSGVLLRAGHTYRLESILNLVSPTGGQYLGYFFYNATTGGGIGDGCYSGFGGNDTYDFHAGCLEIYTPTVDSLIQIKVNDPATATISPSWNTYFLVTELQ